MNRIPHHGEHKNMTYKDGEQQDCDNRQEEGSWTLPSYSTAMAMAGLQNAPCEYAQAEANTTRPRIEHTEYASSTTYIFPAFDYVTAGTDTCLFDPANQRSDQVALETWQQTLRDSRCALQDSEHLFQVTQRVLRESERVLRESERVLRDSGSEVHTVESLRPSIDRFSIHPELYGAVQVDANPWQLSWQDHDRSIRPFNFEEPKPSFPFFNSTADNIPPSSYGSPVSPLNGMYGSHASTASARPLNPLIPRALRSTASRHIRLRRPTVCTDQPTQLSSSVDTCSYVGNAPLTQPRILLGPSNDAISTHSLDSTESSSDDEDSSSKHESGDRCTVCKTTFQRPADLRRHMRKHWTPQHPCEVCDRKFHRMDKLRDHVWKAHKGKVVTTPQGGLECDVPPEAATSPSETFVCSDCGPSKTFLTPGALTKHANRRHVRRYPCNQCEKKFNLGADLKRHQASVHKRHFKRAYRCQDCTKTFSRRDNFLRHAKKYEHALEELQDC
jgi:hypothetical protein